MSQKALVLPKPHGEWVVIERPIPKLGTGELLVKIRATALDPVDWKVRKFGIIVKDIKDFPAILGTEAAGTVADVGEGVVGFAKGDAVFFQGFFHNDKATYQQFATVPAEVAARVPDNISLDEAASIPVGVVTAGFGLYGKRTEEGAEQLTPIWEDGGIGKYTGRPFVVFGGSSSMGQYAIQFAKLSGFSPIISTASLHNADFLKSIGATHVVDRNSRDIRSEITQIVSSSPGSPRLTHVFDGVSLKETQAAAWDVVAPGGELIIVLFSNVDRDKYPDKHVYHMFGTVRVPQNRDEGVKLYSKLTEWIVQGLIKPNRVEVLPNGLHGIPDGLRRLENNEVSGVKLVARPQETK